MTLNYWNTLNRFTHRLTSRLKKLIEEDMKRGSSSKRIDRNEPIIHEEGTYSIETKEAVNSYI